MRRFPAILWLLVYVGSLLILNGSHGKWDPWELALGIALPVIACGLALYLAAGPWGNRPKLRGSYWFVIGTLSLYALAALAAEIFLGPAEALATLLAGIVPLTAVALWLATVRAKTTVTPEGALVDEAAADHTDPVPGVGADDSRPLGDTPQAHDDLLPQDLPKDHPARRAAEARAAERTRTTRDDERPRRRVPPGDRAPRAS
jgi:hypothetical protein